MPEAEVLSIDHNLDYYDISEGTFNSFTTEEYNKINKNAKDLISNNANTDQLIRKAEQEKKTYVDMMQIALSSAGWKFVVKSDSLLN